ncbi:MAG: nitrous oxide reductase accessory protein NosL [Magnetospirillum sp.]|nr:nitrous oxide reductase accessory protein NosL [Magnetospirillum sp.]
MSPFRLVIALAAGLLAAACDQGGSGRVPQALEPGPDAIGTICRMALSEHGGPKGQVFLNAQDKPLWFSSVRDTFTWLLIEDRPGTGLAAIWVNDMGKSTAWDKPAAGAWVEARQAVFVVGSDKGAQMGGSEFVPFADRAAAAAFAASHGGKVMGFGDITREVLAATEHRETAHD